MTKDYSQPDFYRFNEDSLKLVKWILDTYPNPESIVDLGAGCGVIGIELARALKPKELTLVEVQEVFESFLVHNCQEFAPPEVTCSIEIKSYKDFLPPTKYDLVVCNPPYYLPGQGEKAKDPNRATARSFEVDSWKVLILKIAQILSERGRGFLVLKYDKKLIEIVLAEAHLNGIHLVIHQLGLLMILELFRLNKD